MGLAAKLPTARMPLLRWCASLTCQTLPVWVTDWHSGGSHPIRLGRGGQARRIAGLLMHKSSSRGGRRSGRLLRSFRHSICQWSGQAGSHH